MHKQTAYLTAAAALPLTLLAMIPLASDIRPLVSGGCRPTQPNGAGITPESGVNHGNRNLLVSLPSHGRLRPARGDVTPAGAIEAKFGWYRRTPGRLRITGVSVDRARRKIKAHVMHGYGPSGFQPSVLVFPKPGCYRITGRVSNVSLTFVLEVLRPTS